MHDAQPPVPAAAGVWGILQACPCCFCFTAATTTCTDPLVASLFSEPLLLPCLLRASFVVRLDAAAFRQNAITALDFPLLVNSGGALLQTELGMTSLLHQQQLLRGMKRLILGLGETPSPPRGLVCTSAGLGAGAGGSGGPGPINGGVGRSSGEGGGIRISWELPSQLGRPQFHKYVLQRQAVVLDGAGSGSAGGAGRSGGSSGTGNGYGAWDLVGEPDDEDTSWLDTLLAGASSRSGSASGWRYRLVAWNAYGPSDPAISPPCIVTRAAHDLPPTQQRLRQTAAAANAAALWMGTASGKRGGGAPSGASGGAAEAAATAAAAAALDTAAGMAPGQRLWAWPTLTSVLATVAALLYLWGMLTERQASEQQDQRAAGSASEQDCPVEAEQQQQQQQLVAPAPHAAEADSAAGEEARLSPFDVSEQQQRPDYGHVRHTSSAASLEELASGYSASPDPDVQVLPGAWRDEEELHLAVQRGLHCAHPGCHRRFDRLRDLKHKAQVGWQRVGQRVWLGGKGLAPDRSGPWVVAGDGCGHGAMGTWLGEGCSFAPGSGCYPALHA